ncbi:MAG: flagellar biosynthesis/type III secretory pathway protein FliH [Myxococcota bacterium]
MQLTPLFQIEARVSPLDFGEMMPSALHWTAPTEEAEPEEVVVEPEGPHPAELALEAAEARHTLELDALKAQAEAARAEGIGVGRQEREPEIEAMSEALGKAVGTLNETAASLERQSRTDAVELAVTMAQALLGDALRHDQSAVLESVLWRAFEHVPASDEAVIRCHQADREVMESHLPSLAARRGDLLNLRVVASPTVERGGLVIDFSGGGVDAQPTTALELLRESVESVLATLGDAPGADVVIGPADNDIKPEISAAETAGVIDPEENPSS